MATFIFFFNMLIYLMIQYDLTKKIKHIAWKKEGIWLQNSIFCFWGQMLTFWHARLNTSWRGNTISIKNSIQQQKRRALTQKTLKTMFLGSNTHFFTWKVHFLYQGWWQISYGIYSERKNGNVPPKSGYLTPKTP